MDPHFDGQLDAWVLSRYADVSEALREPCLVPAAALSNAASLVDAAVHANFRSQALQMVAALPLQQWEELAVSMAPTGGLIDLIGEYAIPWSQRIAGMAAGVADADVQRCTLLARDVFLAAGEPFDAHCQQTAQTATAELFSYLAPIPMQMFVALSQSLPAFLGGAWLALLQNRDQIPDCDGKAIEELLRFAGPSRTVFRHSIAPVTIGGQSIRANQRVILHLDRANRDPRQFPAPDELQLRRSAAGHLAFGAGGHACVAGALIRSAAWAATKPLLDRLRTAELLSADSASSSGLRFYTSLRVRCAVPAQSNQAHWNTTP